MDFEITDPRLAGACREADPELFAPISEVGASLRQKPSVEAVMFWTYADLGHWELASQVS